LPFLVLLLSGGHCLLAVVKKVNEYLLLGQSIDDAPGEALDKVLTDHMHVQLYLYCLKNSLFDFSGCQAIAVKEFKRI